MINSSFYSSHVLLLTSNLQTLEICLKTLKSYKLCAIVPTSLESTCSALKSENPSLHVIYVDSYLNSGQIELAALNYHGISPFDCILALEEIDILRAAQIRKSLDLKGQSLDSAQVFTDKLLMKAALEKAKINVPPYEHVSSILDVTKFINKQGYPVVVKPSSATENKGVFILKNEQDLETLAQSSDLFNFESPWAVEVESFVKGTLYHVNGLVSGGKIIYIWPSVYLQQPIDLNQGLSAASYTLSSTNPLLSRLNDYGSQILQALPTPSEAAFHLEVFLTPSKDLVFCEIASRIGGKGVNKSWIESFGIDLVSQCIKAQVGEKSPSPSLMNPRVLSGEIWFPMTGNAYKASKKECPFTWVQSYELPSAPENTPKNAPIESHQITLFGGASLLIADTEKEMEERLRTFSQWFKDTYTPFLKSPEKKYSKLSAVL